MTSICQGFRPSPSNLKRLDWWFDFPRFFVRANDETWWATAWYRSVQPEEFWKIATLWEVGSGTWIGFLNLLQLNDNSCKESSPLVSQVCVRNPCQTQWNSCERFYADHLFCISFGELDFASCEENTWKTNTLLQKALMTYENPFSWGRNTCGFPHQGWTDHPTDHQKLEVRVHDQGILFRSVEDWSDLHYQVYPQRSFLAFCNAEKFVQSCSHIKQFACTHQPRAIPYCDIAGWNSWQWQAGNAWTCRWKWALSMRVGPRFITLQTGGIAGLLRLSSAEGPEKTRFNRAWTFSGCLESSSQWYCDACEAITCHWLDQQGLVDYHRNQRAKTESSVCLW